MTHLSPEFIRFGSERNLRVSTVQPTQLPPVAWTIDFLAASPARDSEAYDAHMRNTFGSTSDWTDEYRFDNTTHQLRSIILHVPEEPAAATISDEWTAAPLIIGGLAPVDQSPFPIEPVDRRVLSPDGSLLLCTQDVSSTGSPWRLQITDDMALLFKGEQYAGWMLSNPILHLAPWSTPQPGQPLTAHLTGAIHELLALVTPDSVSALTDEDEAVIRRLRQLSTTVNQLPDGCAKASLRRKVDDMLETFAPA